MSNLPAIIKMSENVNIKSRLNEVLKDEAGAFITSVINISRSNSMLQECSPDSVWGAAMKAASLKLPVEPSLGYAYVIPYKNKGGTEAQFQIGYKGLLQLAIRSGQYKSIFATPVYADEIESYHPVTNYLKLKQNAEEFKMRYDTKSKPCGYYAKLELLAGFVAEIYMPVKAVEAHGKRFSKSFGNNSSPWTTDFDAMAEKTVLKKLLSRYGILSVEMRRAVQEDDASDNAEQEAQKETVAPKEAPGGKKKDTVIDADTTTGVVDDFDAMTGGDKI